MFKQEIRTNFVSLDYQKQKVEEHIVKDLLTLILPCSSNIVLEKNMFEWKNLLAFIVTITGISSCGVKKPDVKQQFSSSLEVPEFYTPENNFSLSSGSDNQISYSGSLLIWNPEAKEEHVAKVLSKSVETKLADAQ